MLNHDKVISDIIDKHGRITSERPLMPIAGGLVSHDLRTVIRQTAPWTEGRRVMHHLFSGSVLRTYGNWQEIESLLLLSDLVQDPERWYAHIYRYSTAVYYRMVMGDRLRKSKAELDEFQKIAIEFIWSVFRSPIDFFPQLDRLPHFLQWFWRPFWDEMGRRHHEVSRSWWEPIQESVRNGTAKSSFVRDTLLHPDVKYRGNEEEAMYLATSVIAAGADNTRMTLNVFIMAACCYPDIFTRARIELDQQCGGEVLRLPGIGDMDSLPYMSAIVKEVLRWRPTVPMSPPHELTEDLEYAGHTFPKGTNFVINVVATCHNTIDYDNFDPERWLNGNEKDVVDGLWVFGGGRRICVGYKVAQQALFVAMARMILCFDISPVSLYPLECCDVLLLGFLLITYCPANSQCQREPLDSHKLNHMTISEPFPVNINLRGYEYGDLITKETEVVNANDA